MSDTVITNVRVVTPREVLDTSTVTVRDGRIASVVPGNVRMGNGSVDGNGFLLLPGFIDLHNDGIEQEIEPRPGAVFPVAVALQSLQARLVSHGITTIYHSFSFMDGREGSLAPERLEPTIRELAGLAGGGFIRHRVHTRYEIIETHHAERFRRLIGDRIPGLVSFMDHTPGQGQYTKPENQISYFQRKYNMPLADIQAIMDERRKKAANPEVEKTLEALVAFVRAAGLPMASHDDDTPHKVIRMHGRGVTISEFPVALEAAQTAAGRGMHVVVGAPNVLRGQSTNGNLNAREAIARGAVDILCSDYHTPSMLHAVFALVRDATMTLPRAVRMTSLNPARAVGLDAAWGSIEPGKRADLLLVEERDGVPSVRAVWVDGREVFRAR
jgi:alpha-D-ribose 1-methylphosphonate 5-triphosphate diphosphatase